MSDNFQVPSDILSASTNIQAESDTLATTQSEEQSILDQFLSDNLSVEQEQKPIVNTQDAIVEPAETDDASVEIKPVPDDTSIELNEDQDPESSDKDEPIASKLVGKKKMLKRLAAKEPKKKRSPSDQNSVTIRPPNRPFHTLSSSQQRAIVYNLKRGIELISGGDFPGFFEHLCERTDFGRENLKPILGRKQLDGVVTSIRDLHEKSVAAKKPALLSLVANQFHHKELLQYGFKCSASQFSRARTMNKRGGATLEDYVRVMPPSKRPKDPSLAGRRPKPVTKPRPINDAPPQFFESQITFDFDLPMNPNPSEASQF